jgi:predicted MFS family arabinose efflux permease
MWPAWTASMSGLVEPHEVESAATLNNLSYNVAAIVGPALGGVLFSWVGPGALFIANALSFLGLLAVYGLWWREGGARPALGSLMFVARLREGFATAFGCVRYRRILLNVCSVFFASIAFAALLPVFVKDILRMNSGVFGVLMASLGVGAVGGALLLPTLRQHMGKTRLLGMALLVYGTMLLALPLLRSLAVMVPLIVAAGMAWSATVSTLNAAAQLAFPASIRARTLSIYLFVMAGGYTAGSLVWGRIADWAGVQVALAAAGACIIVNAIALLNGKHETAI